jgi:ABC-2 type transport system ATP-binding protein
MQPIVSITDVSKTYATGFQALKNISLDIHKGEIFALLGPNGAGKTTAVRLLLGLTRPSSGTARLFDEDPRSLAARRRTGVMLQIAKVPETLRVREHIHLFCSYYPNPMDVDAVLSAAGLSSVARRRYGDLSGGQRQRVQFALAISGNPDLLFLDEPTVGLDVESRRAFWQQVRRLTERGCSILLTTHYLEEADALADRVIVVNGGKIVADGSPHDIKGLAASRRVRCVTSIPASEVRSLAGVQSVRHDGAALEILSHHAEGLARDLLIRDPSLSGLEITSAGLEEAVLSLTSRTAPIVAPEGGVR